MADSEELRAGLNEAIFRQVNEEVRDLDRTLVEEAGRMMVICECSDTQCTQRFELAVSEYERVRADSLLYVIVSGHEFPEVDRLVEHRDGWDVVRKVGVASEIAEETDPRS